MRSLTTTALLITAFLAMATASGDELQLANGSTVPYQELILSEDAPMSLVTLKSAGTVHTYRYSEVAIDALPAELKQRIGAYAHDQLQKRMIIKDDKWIHRDEVLLNGDPRYAAKGKLAKIGPSILTFTNTTDRTVTIGVRCDDKGYEMHVEAGKSKGYQVQNGKVSYIMAQESDDGKKLVVQTSAPLDLKNVNMKVTIVKTDAIPRGRWAASTFPSNTRCGSGRARRPGSGVAAGPPASPALRVLLLLLGVGQLIDRVDGVAGEGDADRLGGREVAEVDLLQVDGGLGLGGDLQLGDGALAIGQGQHLAVLGDGDDAEHRLGVGEVAGSGRWGGRRRRAVLGLQQRQHHGDRQERGDRENGHDDSVASDHSISRPCALCSDSRQHAAHPVPLTREAHVRAPPRLVGTAPT